MSNTHLSLDLRPSRDLLRFDEEHEIYVDAVITAPPITNKVARAPLVISVAMDVSGSMSGRKIQMARDSLTKLVEHCLPGDRVGIVAFTDHVDPVLGLTEMDTAGKAAALKAIQSLHAQNSTNLSGGVLQSLKQINDYDHPKGAVRRCLVFTDGIANAGITDPEKLAEAVMEMRGTVGISTFGYGRNHNSVLLEKIAQDGDFYYIDTPDKILTAFGAEMGGLLSTYAQTVELRITPSDGVEIVRVLNDLSVKDDNGTAVITCDDILAEQDYHVVIQIKTSTRNKALPRRTSILKGSISYYNVVDKGPGKATGNLKVHFCKAGDESTEDNTAVMEEVAYQLIAAGQAEAIRLADAGDMDGARGVLIAAAAFSADIGTSKSQALAGATNKLVEDNYRSQAFYASTGSHGARAMSKGITRRRVSHTSAPDLADHFGTKAVGDTEAAFGNQEPVPAPDQTVAPGPKRSDILSQVGGQADPPTPKGFAKRRSR